MVQFPLPSAEAEPTLASRSLVRATVLFASAVPEIVGVVSLVTSSVLDVPVSEPAARSRDAGAATEASIVTASADEAELVLPAASAAVAVRLCVPS